MRTLRHQSAGERAIRRIRHPAERVYAQLYWTWLAIRPKPAEFRLPPERARAIERRIERATQLSPVTRLSARPRRTPADRATEETSE